MPTEHSYQANQAQITALVVIADFGKPVYVIALLLKNVLDLMSLSWTVFCNQDFHWGVSKISGRSHD